jgi:hypothetical protein
MDEKRRQAGLKAGETRRARDKQFIIDEKARRERLKAAALKGWETRRSKQGATPEDK